MASQPPVTGPSGEESLRPLLLIFVAMLTAQLMLVGLMTFLVSQGHGGTVANGEVFVVVGALLAATMVSGAVVVTTIIARKMQEGGNPAERVNQVRSLFIVRMALIEGATMVNAIFYLLTQNVLFLAFTAVTLTAFVIFRPKL
jgi:hypothetical protein